MKRIFVILGLTACLAWIRAEDLRVVSYNVENLFHPKHDTVCIDSTTFIEKDDYEWTPDGERRWSYTRYYRKVENIARVLTNIGEWDGVDIVGLQEVENALCVKRLCYTLRPGEYDFVHFYLYIVVTLVFDAKVLQKIRMCKLYLHKLSISSFFPFSLCFYFPILYNSLVIL